MSELLNPSQSQRLLHHAMDTVGGAMLRLEQNAHCCMQDVASEYARPSVVRRPRIFPDGDQWCALLGDDLQSGVAGFGVTPEAACKAFDKEWAEGRAPAHEERGTTEEGE